MVYQARAENERWRENDKREEVKDNNKIGEKKWKGRSVQDEKSFDIAHLGLVVPRMISPSILSTRRCSPLFLSPEALNLSSTSSPLSIFARSHDAATPRYHLETLLTDYPNRLQSGEDNRAGS